MTDYRERLAAGGALALPYEEAIGAIEQLTRDGMRLERWEGQVVLPDGTRAASLQFGGSFALSRDPARAAAVGSGGITKARDEWTRKPEFDGAQLQFVLTFGRV